MHRLISLGLLLSFLICYLEWGGGNSGFIFQLEFSVFTKDENKDAFIHPLIFLPLLGQLLILLSIFLKPNRKLVVTGIIMTGILVSLILLVGILSTNIKMILSTFPFISIAVFYFYSRKKHSL